MKIKCIILRTKQNIDVEVNPSDKIELIINTVAAELNITAENIKLVHKQFILKPQQTIEEAKLTDGVIINVSAKGIKQEVVEETKPVIQKKTEETPKPAPTVVQKKVEVKETEEQNYPKSYLDVIAPKQQKVTNSQPISTNQQEKPSNVQQAGQRVDIKVEPQPTPGRVQIQPEMIISLDNNPLLPDYIDDLLQNPERVQNALKNPKLQLIMKEYFGEDPMITQSLKNPAAFLDLMKQSNNIYRNAPNRADQEIQSKTNTLKQKWFKQLQTIKDMGITSNDDEIVQLLEQFDGDIEQVVNILLGM
ncbi:Ubiquitin_protein [Hexamita inflata]|uniref:Putative n=1 Tax=Hexamita inflata TaxID=28002 RepID=A0AA86RBD8_9EUKA|nr:Ubiquitin protein [Hexamita inflata]